MQVALLGEMPFGEMMMLEIIAASTGADISNVTLETYHKGSKEQKAEWEDTYKNNVVARIMILNCADTSIREKIEESIRVGNGKYPTIIRASTNILMITMGHSCPDNPGARLEHNQCLNWLPFYFILF